MTNGKIGVTTENIFPVIKKFLYSEHEIFLRELVGAGNAVVVPTPAYMPFLSVPKLYDVDVIEIEMLQGTDAGSRKGAVWRVCAQFPRGRPMRPVPCGNRGNRRTPRRPLRR